MRYRLYLDESGDHTLPNPNEKNENNVGKRYLGLVGVMMPADHRYFKFHADLEALKKDVFPQYDPDDPIVLHRREIVRADGAFSVLRDRERRRQFDEALLALLRKIHFEVIAVVVDKTSHGRKTYRRLSHPYHYGLHAMLERYCGLLSHRGDVGDVMAERRGGTRRHIAPY